VRWSWCRRRWGFGGRGLLLFLALFAPGGGCKHFFDDFFCLDGINAHHLVDERLHLGAAVYDLVEPLEVDGRGIRIGGYDGDLVLFDNDIYLPADAESMLGKVVAAKIHLWHRQCIFACSRGGLDDAGLAIGGGSFGRGLLFFRWRFLGGRLGNGFGEKGVQLAGGCGAAVLRI